MAPAPSESPPSGSWALFRSPPNDSWPQVDTGPSQALVRPLASKRNEFVTQLNDAATAADQGCRACRPRWPTSSQGPQNYLVLAANNAEMRAGSGTFLEVGEATTADGLGTISATSVPPATTPFPRER